MLGRGFLGLHKRELVGELAGGNVVFVEAGCMGAVVIIDRRGVFVGEVMIFGVTIILVKGEDGGVFLTKEMGCDDETKDARRNGVGIKDIERLFIVDESRELTGGRNTDSNPIDIRFDLTFGGKGASDRATPPLLIWFSSYQNQTA